MFKIKVLKIAKLLNQYKKQLNKKKTKKSFNQYKKQLNKKKLKKDFALIAIKKVKSKKTKKLKNNSKANENQVK